MPGPCGAEAIARLKAERPGIVLIRGFRLFQLGARPERGSGAFLPVQTGRWRAVKRRELIQAVAELVGPPAR